LYRIRFHGRGGQGIKTAARILGSAFFAEGFEVQDAPRYGAERRGAPLYATVRAALHPIDERGEILRPDLVVLADEMLAAVPATRTRCCWSTARSRRRSGAAVWPSPARC
jgi:pyruvate ferredoxin oxidoreductase gamma subunit